MKEIMRIIGSAATKEAMRIALTKGNVKKRGGNAAGHVNFVNKKRAPRYKGPPETNCPFCKSAHKWNRTECYNNPSFKKDDPSYKWCARGCGRNKSHTTAEHKGPDYVRGQRRNKTKKFHKANITNANVQIEDTVSSQLANVQRDLAALIAKTSDNTQTALVTS